MIHQLIGTGAKDILWWQECIRAVIVFAVGLVMLRLLGRRAFGQQTPLDILMAIVVGSNLSRAVTANAAFFPTIAATLVMLFVYWLLAHCTARWHGLGRIVKGRPVGLVAGGRFDRRAMRRAAVSEADMEEAARSASVKDAGGVEQAMLERSGKISIVPRK